MRLVFKRSTVCEVMFDNGVTKVFRRVCTCKVQDDVMILEVMTDEAGRHDFVQINKSKVCYHTFVDEYRYKPE